MKPWIFLLALAVLAAGCAPPALPATPTVSATATPAASETPVPAPQQAARDALAMALSLPAGQISLVSAEEVDWPSACLGVDLPGIACAQVITPGFRVLLGAEGRRYEYHTNQDGGVVVPASLALTWHREGGIAGFCDDLVVFASGEVRATPCGGGQPGPNGTLTAAEREQLHAWLGQYAEVSLTQKDPAVADAMTLALSLKGAGPAQPGEAEKQALLAWAQDVYNRVAAG